MDRLREAEGRTLYGRWRLLLGGVLLLAGSIVSDVGPVQSREPSPPDRTTVAAAPAPDKEVHPVPSPGGSHRHEPAVAPVSVGPDRQAGPVARRPVAPGPAPHPAPLAALELPAADAARYRLVFDLQDRGEWAEADAAIAEIRDQRLMGHVRQQRLMHPTAYKATYAELRAWLEHHADLPEADKVHQLALRRMAKGDPRPRRPVEAAERIPVGRNGREGLERPPVRPLERGGEVTPRGRQAERTDEARKAARDLARSVAARLEAGEAEAARAALDAAEGVEPLDLDAARAEVAAHLFFQGRAREAQELARAAAERSGEVLPRAHWIAGLASWGLGQTERAARHFEALAGIEDVAPWDKAAGAFWAARAHGKLRRPAERARWLEVAADEPRTFYGLVAAEALGRPPQLEFRLPELSPRHARALAERPEARRAVALVQVGQVERAELELRRVNPEGDPALEQALVALADKAGMPALALRLGSVLKTATGDLYDAALYPLPRWRPQEGFRVDRALLFALMRQESRFSPGARSGAGAAGLMQLMPETARFMAEKAEDPADARELLAPERNMALGQRYVLHLAEIKDVGDNMLSMLAAYNWGPGNLQRWRREAGPIDDPLLFLERIPVRETRGFVQLVMANYWIYRHRLGQPAPSLTDVAAGRWPLYIPQESAETQVALDAEDR